MVVMEIKKWLFWVIATGLLQYCFGQPRDEPFILSDLINITATEGTSVKLPCQSGGYPTPTLSWARNDVTVTLPRRNSRRKINSVGTFRFKTVKVIDEGWYQCTAENQYGRATSDRIYLRVEVPAKIVEGPKNDTTSWGTTVTLRCTVQGRPTPTLEWRKNSEVIPDPVSGKLFSSPKLVVNVTENATYTCKTQNSLRDSVAQAEASARVSYREDTRPLGLCSSEVAPVCSHHLPKPHSVFRDIDHSLEEISTILEHLFKNGISGFDPICQEAMQTLLCHQAFPECKVTQNQQYRPKPLCRESCVQVTNVLCPHVNWEDIKYHTQTHRELQEQDGSFSSQDLYNWAHVSPEYCDSLPIINYEGQKINTSDHSDNEDGDVSKDKMAVPEENHQNGIRESKKQLPLDQCVHVAFEFVDGQLPPDMCYHGNGDSYTGNVSITETGRNCILWSDYEDEGSLAESSHNYCRNPKGQKERPWCPIYHPVSNSQHWEYCPLLKCSQKDEASIINPQNIKESSEHVFFSFEFLSILGTVAACGAGILCIVFVIFHVTCRRRNHLQNGFQGYLKPSKQDQMLQSFSIDIGKMSKNGFYHQRLSSVSSNGKLERLEFPRNEITYLEDIADGAFGKVFKGRARCYIRGNFEEQLIAVKTLRENCIATLEEEMVKEAELMVELDHPNIIKLLGVCLQEKPMCIFYEYMNEGDLEGFLRRKAPPQFPVKKKAVDSHKGYLTAPELLDIAKQICSGMMYLANHGFVHRDLATRNCLISDNLVVKISDFALIQSTEYKNYFRGKEYDPIPIRWMPLEAILLNQFTTFSDIWSFGIVLWEIFSYAQQPYYGLSHEEVIDFLKQGRVLPPPEDSPKEVYAIMKKCWNYKAQERPKFSTVYSGLSCCRQELSDKTKLSL